MVADYVIPWCSERPSVLEEGGGECVRVCGACAHACATTQLQLSQVNAASSFTRSFPALKGRSKLWALGLTDCSSNPGFAA